MEWLLGGVGFVVVFALAFLAVVAVANRMLRNTDRDSATSMGDAFGNFIDVFDPGQARAARDLKDHENVGAIIPSPDDDDPPMKIIDSDGRRIVRIRQRDAPPPGL